ncbi:hypothetical protein NPIL_585241 [Nephila pilipes]|uniref:Uncharacterized protein n=1 Tax=Nephila pilipes TaxID=299642 RepID=A0A8X6P7N4_NEPPI|nr:hypothetical protein NPIL_585241 [Nephila pilipes]
MTHPASYRISRNAFLLIATAIPARISRRGAASNRFYFCAGGREESVYLSSSPIAQMILGAPSDSPYRKGGRPPTNIQCRIKLSELITSDWALQFQWVFSHMGVPNNEIADVWRGVGLSPINSRFP